MTKKLPKSLSAINADWSCNIHDPRNARFLRPLALAADEETAREMASISAESDDDYEQRLVDARRMLRDRDYWGLFAPDGDFPPLQ